MPRTLGASWWDWNRCLTGSFDLKLKYSYNLARMHFEIILAPEAIEDWKRLEARELATVKQALETHLRFEPLKESKSRIKHLRGFSRPQYRLRIDELRVFYDVNEKTVEVLAIVLKPDANAWLEQFGIPEPTGQEENQ
jgi:mRNA interferase RelE/StbE